jgi:hypothetical protein
MPRSTVGSAVLDLLPQSATLSNAVSVVPLITSLISLASLGTSNLLHEVKRDVHRRGTEGIGAPIGRLAMPSLFHVCGWTMGKQHDLTHWRSLAWLCKLSRCRQERNEVVMPLYCMHVADGRVTGGH